MGRKGFKEGGKKRKRLVRQVKSTDATEPRIMKTTVGLEESPLNFTLSNAAVGNRAQEKRMGPKSGNSPRPVKK